MLELGNLFHIVLAIGTNWNPNPEELIFQIKKAFQKRDELNQKTQAITYAILLFSRSLSIVEDENWLLQIIYKEKYN